MAGNIINIFQEQQAFKFELRKSGAAERIEKLRRLRKSIVTNETMIYAALDADLRKSAFESAVTEVMFILGELDFAVSRLKRWMRPVKAGRTLSNFFVKNRIYHEPKGVCLIIAPWNYPFQLVMSPLISAIAAGNCVMVKPSEISGTTSSILADIISETFEQREVACVEGDAAVSKELLTLPFDHIFFTGGTSIGKIVMEAAAKNLTSVTLELGGKSPAVILPDADLQKAARKIAWGKLVNSGQTCIAPDYVLIHTSQEASFISLYKQHVLSLFYTGGNINPAAYGKIVNPAHFHRLKELINTAVTDGAELAFGGTADESSNVLEPSVLVNVSPDSRVMQEEIFGPVLPVVSYKNLEEAVDLINSKSKPLALYIFGGNRKGIDQVLQQTSAGGTCVNDVLIQITNPNLPFGGVNSSGMGSCHGYFGFKTFSHERAVAFQSKIDFTGMIYPPYENKSWVLKLLKKIM